MTLTWKSFLAIVFVVVALFLLANAPAVDTPKEFGYSEVEQSTELIAVDAIDTDTSALASVERFERLPESPGGVIANVTTCTKVTDHAKEVLPGGAVGVAGIGIRGPTSA